MGRLAIKPFDLAEGQEYVDYLARVQSECRRLSDEGRLPATEELRAFLATAGHIVAQLRSELEAASRRGETVVSPSISLSASEHSRMRTMNDSLRNLLEILEMRQAIDLNRTPAVGRVAQAVMAGDFSE